MRTVRAIPDSAALTALYGPGWLSEHVPSWLLDVHLLGLEAWQWGWLLLACGLAVGASLAGGALASSVARRLAARHANLRDRLGHLTSGPVRLVSGLAVFSLLANGAHLSGAPLTVLGHLERAIATVAFAWVALRALSLGAALLQDYLVRDGTEGPHARSAVTRVMVLKSVASFVVVVVAGALFLLQFDALRAIGTSLLASAGFLGIVVGFAAQRSLATVLAGLQLSLTQPIRVGDVVVVEGETGTIEEITVTYVVVKVWDLRRLVVPITRFLESPFQNWSRNGTELLATVFVRADFGVPVDSVRQALARFVPTRPEWDGKTLTVAVTDASERTVQLRVLVSAPDPDRSWDLCCAIREHLVAFLRQLDGGRYLPRERLESTAAAEGSPARPENTEVTEITGARARVNPAPEAGPPRTAAASRPEERAAHRGSSP